MNTTRNDQFNYSPQNSIPVSTQMTFVDDQTPTKEQKTHPSSFYSRFSLYVSNYFSRPDKNKVETTVKVKSNSQFQSLDTIPVEDTTETSMSKSQTWVSWIFHHNDKKQRSESSALPKESSRSKRFRLFKKPVKVAQTESHRTLQVTSTARLSVVNTSQSDVDITKSDTNQSTSSPDDTMSSHNHAKKSKDSNIKKKKYFSTASFFKSKRDTDPRPVESSITLTGTDSNAEHKNEDIKDTNSKETKVDSSAVETDVEVTDRKVVSSNSEVTGNNANSDHLKPKKNFFKLFRSIKPFKSSHKKKQSQLQSAGTFESVLNSDIQMNSVDDVVGSGENQEHKAISTHLVGGTQAKVDCTVVSVDRVVISDVTKDKDTQGINVNGSSYLECAGDASEHATHVEATIGVRDKGKARMRGNQSHSLMLVDPILTIEVVEEPVMAEKNVTRHFSKSDVLKINRYCDRWCEKLNKDTAASDPIFDIWVDDQDPASWVGKKNVPYCYYSGERDEGYDEDEFFVDAFEYFIIKYNLLLKEVGPSNRVIHSDPTLYLSNDCYVDGDRIPMSSWVFQKHFYELVEYMQHKRIQIIENIVQRL
ncbi:hypothetical protein BC833DRAFT_318273 [Globomyces pollinis-pini]|nr:hypothetical protein BC833DRAFT_318273 [Globomyces pollinis-pini]